MEFPGPVPETVMVVQLGKDALGAGLPIFHGGVVFVVEQAVIIKQRERSEERRVSRESVASPSP